MDDAVLKAIVQLVQLPMYSLVLALVCVVARRVRYRAPWYWLIVGLAAVLLRRLLALYWLGSESVLFFAEGVLPVITATGALVWVVMLCRDLTRSLVLRR